MVTDRTRACAACRLRLRAHRLECPICGAATTTVAMALPTLTATANRQQIDRARARWRRSPWWQASAFVASGGVLGFLTTGSLTAALAFAAIALPGAILAVFDRGHPPVVTPQTVIPFRIGDDDVPEARGESVTGQAVAVTDLPRAPVSGRLCIAFRVVGHADGISIDDGGVAETFWVIDPEGRRVAVVGETTAVRIPCPTEAFEIEPSDRLRSWMTELGLPSLPASVHLAEAVVLEHDRVVVTGRPAQRPDPDGPSATYRSAPQVTELRGDVDAPLSIERA